MMIHPHAQRMRRLVLEGKLGKLVWATADAAIGTYHTNESVRQGNDVLSNIDPSWYFKKPAGGPLFDVTVYALHFLTGIVGPAKRVTAMSGLAVKEREFRGKMIPCEMDDNTLMLLDFDGSFFALGYGTPTGSVVRRFCIFGTEGSIRDRMFGETGSSGKEALGQKASSRMAHTLSLAPGLPSWLPAASSSPSSSLSPTCGKSLDKQSAVPAALYAVAAEGGRKVPPGRRPNRHIRRRLQSAAGTDEPLT